MKNKVTIDSSYLRSAYDIKKRKEILLYAVRELRKVSDLFDFFVFRGTSGLLVGPDIAGRLNKPFAVIRKNSDNSHYCRTFEGSIVTGGKYIVIDDFIDGGSTIANIIMEISKIDVSSKFIGAYLYLPNTSVDGMISDGFEKSNHYIIGPFIKNWDYPPTLKENKYSECVSMENHRERMLVRAAEST